MINWENEGRLDRLIYPNGLDYIRTFKTWEEGSGYTLEIGKEGGPQSYVIWEIKSLGVNSSDLKLQYIRIFDWVPNFLAFIPHRMGEASS